VIDKELPGFTIVPSDLISPIEDSPDHPRRQTVITADFNGDGKKDFAAMVVKTDGNVQISRGQPFGIIVCYSSVTKRYECGLIGGTGSMRLPLSFYLEAVKPGKLHCFDSWAEVFGKDTRPLGHQEYLGEKTLLTKTTSIGHYRTMGNGDVVYVYQSKKRFLSCITSD
ncbi:MAG: hypothetical protein ACYC05_15535, partial [Sulfuricella sp.]